MEQFLVRIQNKLEGWPLPAIVKKVLRQWLTMAFLRYLAIGFTTFFLQIGLLYVFTQLFGFDKVPGNIFSTLISMVFNFIASNFWTFKAGNTGKSRKLGKYLSLAVINYIFDTVLAFPLLAITLGFNQYIAKVIVTGMIVMWNYFLYKFWVFKA